MAAAAVHRTPRGTQVLVVAAVEARHQQQRTAGLRAAAPVVVERLGAFPARRAGQERVRRGDREVRPGVRDGYDAHGSRPMPLRTAASASGPSATTSAST